MNLLDALIGEDPKTDLEPVEPVQPSSFDAEPAERGSWWFDQRPEKPKLEAVVSPTDPDLDPLVSALVQAPPHKRTLWDALGDVTEKPLRFLDPTGAAEAYDTYEVWDAGKALENGADLSPRQKHVLWQLIEEQQGGASMGYNAASIALAIPAWGAGLGLSGVVTKSAGKAARAVLGKSLREGVEKAAGLSARAVLRGAADIAGRQAVMEGAGIAAQDLFGDPRAKGGRIAAKAWELAMPGLGFEDSDAADGLALALRAGVKDFSETLGPATISSLIETGTELAGSKLMQLPGLNRIEALEGAFVRWVGEKTGLKGSDLLRHITKAGGFGGSLAGEWVEEREADILHAITPGDPLHGRWDLVEPDAERWATEALGLAMGGGALGAAHAVLGEQERPAGVMERETPLPALPPSAEQPKPGEVRQESRIPAEGTVPGTVPGQTAPAGPPSLTTPGEGPMGTASPVTEQPPTSVAPAVPVGESEGAPPEPASAGQPTSTEGAAPSVQQSRTAVPTVVSETEAPSTITPAQGGSSTVEPAIPNRAVEGSSPSPLATEPPVEAAAGAPDATGIKRASLEKQLAEMGLEPPARGDRESFVKWHGAALERIQRDAFAGQKLVEELVEKPRQRTAEEAALINLELVRLANERDAAQDAYNADPSETNLATVERVQAAYKRAADVNARSVTTVAQALVAQQFMMKRDFSLAAIERRMVTARGGKSISPEARQRYAEMAAEIERIEKKLDEKLAVLERQQSRAEARAQRKSARKESIDRSKERIEELFSELMAQSGRARSGLDTDTLRVVTQLAVEHVKIGYNTFVQFADTVVARAGDAIRPYLEKAWDDAKRIVSNTSPEALKVAADDETAKVFRQLAGRQTRYMGNKREFLDKNAALLSQLANRHLQDVETIFDVYAGGGTYGLTYAASGTMPKLRQVVINEVDPIRRAKLEQSIARGGDFLDIWERDPKLRKFKSDLNKLIKKSTTPAATAIDAASAAGTFADASTEVRAAILAIRDVMFSGRTADMERLFENAATDADRIKRLAQRAKARGVDVEVTSLDALGQEMRDRVANAPRSLVLLDPPYHETASGNYSAGDASYSFASDQFMHETLRAAKQAADAGHVVLYHNKATQGVAEVAGAEFDGRMFPGYWTRQNGQREFVGVYDGQSQGYDIGGDVEVEAAPAASGGVGGQPGVVEEAGRDTGREPGRRAERATDGSRGRRSDAELLAAYKTRTRNTIAELSRRLDAGEFATQPRRHVQFDAEAIKLKVESEKIKRRLRREEALEKRRLRTKSRKATDAVVDVLQTSRALKTSFDFSAMLRQGKLIIGRHPIRSRRAIARMFGATFSEQKFREYEVARNSRELAAFGELSELEQTTLDEELTSREEDIRSSWSEKIPGVRASNRGFVTLLNELRTMAFDHMVYALPVEPTIERGRVLANMINIASGRGNAGTGKFADAVNASSALLWSPRFLLSRFQFLTLQPFYKSVSGTRGQLAKFYAGSLGGMAVYYGVLTMALAWAADDDEEVSIEHDPRSSDFGKIRVGNTRVDPLAGLSQVTVYLSRMISGESQTVEGDREYPVGRGETTLRFLRNKVSPVVGVGIDVATNKDWLGRKIDWDDPQAWANVAQDLALPMSLGELELHPLTFGNIHEQIRAHGWAMGSALNLLSVFGEGLQHYGVNGTNQQPATAGVRR